MTAFRDAPRLNPAPGLLSLGRPERQIPFEVLEGMVSLDYANIYRETFTTISDVVATVRRWGIIVFPGLLKARALSQLNAEFDDMIAARRHVARGVDAYDNLVNLRVDRAAIDEARFPATATFFGQRMMSDIAARYLETTDYQLNYQIFVSNLTETKGPQLKPPFALHFDKRHTLKFFLYLTDTDARNGAMRATPGSIMRNRAVREVAMEEMAIDAIDNIRPEPREPSIPIIGPAGTVFIFDTDISHGASGVQPGHVRRTMRGHTQTRRMLDRMRGLH